MMGVTNLDDLDLETAGIEADEINAEAAAVGSVLTADGAGGASWQGVPSMAVAHYASEETVTLGTWHDLHTDAEMYLYSAGWTLDVTTKALVVPTHLDGQVAIVQSYFHFLTADKTGYCQVRIRISSNGGVSWSNAGLGYGPFIDGAPGPVMAEAMVELAAGMLIKAEFQPTGTPAGDGDLATSEGGWTRVLVPAWGVDVGW